MNAAALGMNVLGFLRPLFPYFGDLVDAVQVTLSLALSAVLLSLIVGTIWAVALRARARTARMLAAAMVEFLRNTPLLVLLYFVYFLLPSLGLRLSPFIAGLLGLTLHEGAYMAEIVRAGLVAVPSGQREAARSLGLSRWHSLRLVTLPQVFRTIYGPLGNQVVSVILASSLASAISLDEVTGWMQTTGAASFRYFSVFLVTAFVYLVLCQSVNLLRLLAGRLLFPGPA